MRSSELLIPGAVAGFVLVLGALVAMRRTHRPSVSRSVMQRMSRPDESADNDITKNDRHRRSGTKILAWFYQLHLLQKLEENLWQAGIYARVADVLLVILLMFAAGLSAGQGVLGAAGNSILE